MNKLFPGKGGGLFEKNKGFHKLRGHLEER